MIRCLLLFTLLFIANNALLAQFIFKPAQVPVMQNGKLLKTPFAGGINAAQYGKVDLTGDGVEDLVIFDRAGNKFTTYIAENNQWIYSPDHAALLPSGIENWIVFADYNCDGKKDIFTWTTFGMKVLKNISVGAQVKWEEVANPLFTQGFSTMTNLQVNMTDIPAIVDLDGDGDLDILVFNFAAGNYIEFHKNLSMENNGNCNELTYKRVGVSWGDFTECSCNKFGFGERCDAGQAFEDMEEDLDDDVKRIMHAAGKALLALDMNGNGVKDLILGMEDCNELYQLNNHGTKDDALIRSHTNLFPNENAPAAFYTFPAAFYEDIDFDGINDLLVSTNLALNPDGMMDLTNTSWLYLNKGQNDNPDFQFVKKNFLQEQMIDIGSHAVPAFIDIDGDGDLDLIIGQRGRNEGGSFSSSLVLFENTGTPESPSLELKNNDYLNIKSLGLYNIKPQVIDINADGKADLVFSATNFNNHRTSIYYLLNKSNSPVPKFEIQDLKQLDFLIHFSESFVLNDIDNDGKIDLLHARSTGRIDYYKNKGTVASPQFELEKAAILGLSVDFSRANPIITVADIDRDGKEELILADRSGIVKIFTFFKNQLDGSPTPEINIFDNKLIGQNSFSNFGFAANIAIGDLFGDGYPAMMVGTQQGGLLLFRNDSHLNDDDFKLQVKVFPNPANSYLNIRVNDQARAEIYNSLGQRVHEISILEKGAIFNLDTSAFQEGLYILKIFGQSKKSAASRFIVKH
jgi:hypothetical protein